MTDDLLLNASIFDYKVYLNMAEKCLQTNPKQAYLCLENALFLCNDALRMAISEMLSELIEAGVYVRPSSIVILSYNSLEFTKLCIESIRKTVPISAREIIVIDNASEDGSVEYLQSQNDIITIFNESNVGFPAGCNQGISAATPGNDIFLLNNDTLLLPNSLFWLRMGLYADENVGAVGSLTNYAGNNQTIGEPHRISLSDSDEIERVYQLGLNTNSSFEPQYENKIYLVGYAMLIKYGVLKKVGVLDEIFSPGNFEDVDYCLRIMQAGYRNVLCHNSFIIHFGSVSFNKNIELYSKLLKENMDKINSKYGFNVQEYRFPKEELIGLIGENTNAYFKVLCLECGLGATPAAIKFKYPCAQVYGSESSYEKTLISKAQMSVENISTEQIGDVWSENYFDYVLVDCVLGTVNDFDMTLKQIVKVLKCSGKLIFFNTNPLHYKKIVQMAEDSAKNNSEKNIPTDLKKTIAGMGEMTGKNIEDLLLSKGFVIDNCFHSRNGEPDEKEKEIIKRFSYAFNSIKEEQYLPYNYYYIIRKK